MANRPCSADLRPQSTLQTRFQDLATSELEASPRKLAPRALGDRSVGSMTLLHVLTLWDPLGSLERALEMSGAKTKLHGSKNPDRGNQWASDDAQYH
ncbi:hypothetical protein HYFRA_00005297 [Hymenoscyphus fraxineus]|uniref:Uncharacterized protein n=1 Tax=Hymenoscyphus fraxineus TaxID=746836 RepID=A0A9N9Q0K9_9HELO|nr:hypothetical protein HYFRA_00005297 [Hymenoscyphus fraxineus]